MIEWLLGVFNHLLVLFKFIVTVLIIITMSLGIVYHLLYVMHLKLDVVIGEPYYICLVHIIVIFFGTGRDLPL
jgi:hypothetical protein